MFGSYPYPPTIILSGLTEDIIIFRKLRGKYKIDRSKKEESKLVLKEWGEWALDFWQISTARSKNHPAIFPEEIPHRLIKLHSFVGDTVLDPFAGSGTTGKAARKLNRNYILIEKDEDYYNLIGRELNGI